MNDVDVKFGAQTGELRQGVTAVVDAFRQMNGSVTSSLSSIKSVYIGLAAVIVSAAAFKQAVATTVEWQKETEALGRAMGTTTEVASTLATAAGDIYLETSQLVHASAALTRQLKANELGFNDLGVATRDANGQLLPTMEIMLSANRVLNEYQAGTDRNIIGQRLYSRGWQELSKIVALNADVIEEARKKNEALNLTVDAGTTAKVSAYRKALNDVGDVLKGISVTIGRAVMPLLTDLANWFASIGPDAVRMTDLAIRTLMVSLQLLALGFRTIYEVSYATFAAIGDTVTGVMSAVNEAVHLRFGSAKQVMIETANAVQARWDAMFNTWPRRQIVPTRRSRS
jgi:hypothetical protein